MLAWKFEKKNQKKQKQNKGLRLTVCLWNSCSTHSPMRETRSAYLEGLSVSLSLASFLLTRINSHYLSAEENEKFTWKTRAGRLSALHLSLFSAGSLPSSPLLTCSPSPRQRKSRQVLDRYSIIQQTVQSLDYSFANFYGLRSLLSAVNLPYCDLQWVYVPSSRDI